MRVLLTRELHDFAMRELRERYDVTVHSGTMPMPPRALKSMVADAEGLICYPYDTIDRGVIDAAEKLRVISTYSVGYDHIDIRHAMERNIQVGYTPDVLTDATADLAMSLMLDVTRRVSEGDRIIRAGRWTQAYGADEYLGRGMQSRTLGILGMGRIGRAVARRARAFGMDVTYHGRHRASGDVEEAAGARYVGLDELVAGSDILSVHVPHTADTDGMLDRKVFARMKRSAFLINTARGKVINQEDLVSALRQGDIAGAGLDVFESEPIAADNPLARMQNVVLTPHIGSSTAEARAEMARIALDNLHLGMAGKKPVHSVV